MGMGNLLEIATGRKALRESLEAEREARQKAEARRAEAEARTATAEARTAEAVALKEEAEALKEEAEALKEEAVALKEEAVALKDGTYYATVDCMWEPAEVEFSDGDLAAIRRQSPHPFYLTTFNAANGNDLIPAFASKRSSYDPYNASSLATNQTDSTQEKIRKRKLKHITIDGNTYEQAEVAHLIPHASNCSRFYGPLAAAAVGGPFEHEHTEESAITYKNRLQVLIHGQYEKNTTSGKHVRLRDTGIKHCRTNMARVTGQKHHLDHDPSLLILPLLSLQQTLEYSGGMYDVLVACTTPKVYVGTLLINSYQLCQQNDVATATATLTSFVKAAACTLRLADSEEIRAKLDVRERKIILESKGKIEATTPHQVKIPVMKMTTASSPTTATTTTTPASEAAWPRLAKLTLDLYEKNTHQECDPFLLFVKAAVVWSSIQGQKLLPGCSPPHDCEYCLAQGFFECDCDAYDPEMPIPHEIHVPSSSEPAVCNETQTNAIDDADDDTNDRQ